MAYHQAEILVCIIRCMKSIQLENYKTVLYDQEGFCSASTEAVVYKK